MTHVITCYLCHSRDYVETVPELGSWFCKCLKKDEFAKIGKKFFQCGNCYRAHYVDNSDVIPKCQACEKAREVQTHGWVRDMPTSLKKDDIIHEFSISELTKRLKTEVVKS